MLKYKKTYLDVTFLDNRYYDNLINSMKPFFDENGFKNNDNIFSNEKIKVKIEYNEPKQMYLLFVSNSEEPDYNEINAWLFDDSQNVKDIEAISIDFCNSLKKELGIKNTRSRNATDNIELPSSTKNGTINITAFTKKMLDIYPTLKDEYKEHVSFYGNFLYINFFGENLVPLFKNTFSNGNKKQIKKLYDVFEDIYLKGDRSTVNTLIAVLCASAYNDEAVAANIKKMLSEDTHFLASFENFLPVLKNNKKLFNALVK